MAKGLKNPVLWLSLLACGLLAACGKDYQEGIGEYNHPIGEYNHPIGEVDHGWFTKEVGLCSYLGGCMRGGGDDDDEKAPAAAAPRRRDSGTGADSGTDAGDSGQ